MLNKKVFREQMIRLKTLFPNWNIDITKKETLATWYKEFKGYSDKEFKSKVTIYVDNSQYNPTVAGIKNSFRHEKKVNQDNATAQEVVDHLKKQGYDIDVETEG